MFDRGQDAAILEQSRGILGHSLFQIGQSMSEDLPIASRRQRKPVFEIMDGKGACLEAQLKLLRFERSAIRLAEDRN